MLTCNRRVNPLSNPYAPLAYLTSRSRDALSLAANSVPPGSALVAYVSLPKPGFRDAIISTLLHSSCVPLGFDVAPAPEGYSPAEGTLYVLTADGYRVA
jgi:hypothetical protein